MGGDVGQLLGGPAVPPTRCRPVASLHRLATRLLRGVQPDAQAGQLGRRAGQRAGALNHQRRHGVEGHPFGNTPEGKWFAENAHRFGFILRYPKEKQEITGVIFEPWHFRFVGRYHAEKIYAGGLCLEEYLQ